VLPTVALERELVFTYSDIHDHNFMFNRDKEGILRLYVIDFEHASFLPVSLLANVVLQEFGCSTPKHIAKRIGATLPVTNLEALGHAAKLFDQVELKVGLSHKDSACSLTPAEGLQDRDWAVWCQW
jgi:aminoglycoside/choline kinase family phosphotransferase